MGNVGNDKDSKGSGLSSLSMQQNPKLTYTEARAKMMLELRGVSVHELDEDALNTLVFGR